MEPPGESPYLPPAEVVRRLAAEFAIVEADAAAGAEHVASMVRQFEQMAAPPEVIEEHRRLQPSAVHMVVADEPDPGEAYLSFAALPGKGLFIGYCSAQHEAAAWPLVERCCRVLGYGPELV